MEEIPNRKPILTIKQQIMHLKQKGVSFELCTESEASRILMEQDHYFRLAAYRVLFPKRVGGSRDGQYAGLDFGHLVDLADINRNLRSFLLPLTLDVENSAKTLLIEHITEKSGEDGYSVLSDYFTGLSHENRIRREGELKRLKNDIYLGSLVSKYQISAMPAWVFLELSSFGTFTNFYLFCANRWGNSTMKDEHYMLRRVNSLRNAAAHSSVIINGLSPSVRAPQSRYSAQLAAALDEIGMSKRLRRSKMRNPRILQMAVLAYTYSRFVSKGRADGISDKLHILVDRFKLHDEVSKTYQTCGQGYARCNQSLIPHSTVREAFRANHPIWQSNDNKVGQSYASFY